MSEELSWIWMYQMRKSVCRVQSGKETTKVDGNGSLSILVPAN